MCPTKVISNIPITFKDIQDVNSEVARSDYGVEDTLITECFRKYSENNDPLIVAMKVALIDTTNSTRLYQHKSKINLRALADLICAIPHFDKRVKQGDAELVKTIAESNGKVNIFSFATKYCCYHNRNIYGRDDYSIYDFILEKSLPLYFGDITKEELISWKEGCLYGEYHKYIGEKLGELEKVLGCEIGRREFDRYIWFKNRVPGKRPVPADWKKETLECLQGLKGRAITSQDVAGLLKIEQSTAKIFLDRLIESGDLEKRGRGRGVRYSLPEGEEELRPQET